MATSSSSASNSSSPCAACKFLRRKCTAECVFAPYFPPDQPHKFANVHKVFGASNITKLLNELPPHKREDAVNSLAYEADARVKDPVYGCVGAISILQRQVAQLQQELAIAQSDLARLASVGGSGMPPQLSIVHGGHHQGGGGVLANAMGMNLSPPAGTFVQHAPSMSARDHQQQQQQLMMQHGRLLGARDAAVEQLLEQLQRDTLLTREQLVEQLTRAGGGSLENGLAALGGLSFNTSHMRSASDGGSGSSGGGNMGHLSPP
eukprot:c25660_g1_i1 orf=446-1234(-)